MALLWQVALMASFALSAAWSAHAGRQLMMEDDDAPTGSCKDALPAIQKDAANWCKAPYLTFYSYRCAEGGDMDEVKWLCRGKDGSWAIATDASKCKPKLLGNPADGLAPTACSQAFETYYTSKSEPLDDEDEPKVTTKCEPVRGFIPELHMKFKTHYKYLAELEEGKAPFDELDGMLDAAAAACLKDPKCDGFDSWGNMADDGRLTNLVKATGTCAYIKDKTCKDTSDMDDEELAALHTAGWCASPALVYKAECDDDDFDDWACRTADGAYVTRKSSNNCAVVKATTAQGMSVCPKAFNAIIEMPTTDGKVYRECDEAMGYVGFWNKDIPSSPASSLEWLPKVPGGLPSRGYFYGGAYALVQRAADACDGTLASKGCIGFNSLGGMKKSFDLSKGLASLVDRPGVCVYIREDLVPKEVLDELEALNPPKPEPEPEPESSSESGSESGSGLES